MTLDKALIDQAIADAAKGDMSTMHILADHMEEHGDDRADDLRGFVVKFRNDARQFAEYDPKNWTKALVSGKMWHLTMNMQFLFESLDRIKRNRKILNLLNSKGRVTFTSTQPEPLDWKVAFPGEFRAR